MTVICSLHQTIHFYFTNGKKFCQRTKTSFTCVGMYKPPFKSDDPISGHLHFSLHFEDRFIEIKKVLKDYAVPQLLDRTADESSCECCRKPFYQQITRIQMNQRIKEMFHVLLNLDVSKNLCNLHIVTFVS
jgi:hypothetical protein